MRIDRLISLAVVRPGLSVVDAIPFISRVRQPAPLAILMYHSISVPSGKAAEQSYYGVQTTPERFERHMQLLAATGRRGVTLTQALDTLSDGSSHDRAGPGVVAITFDDGFRDVFTHAAPILQRYGFSGTVYLPTAFIGDARRTFKSNGCMVWEEVRELHARGIEFGSHTVSHPELVRLSPRRIQTELTRSKSRIEEHLGAPVRHFAYPFAYPQANTPFCVHFRTLLKSAGYATCVTTTIGRVAPQDDRFQLRRLPMNDADDDALFGAKLAGAYDWLSVPQAMLKRLHHTAGPFRSTR